MKRELFRPLISSDQNAPITQARCLREFVWGVVLPALLWYGAVQSRAWILKPKCSDDPTLCVPALVSSFDRMSLGLENPDADGHSYTTQNLSGTLAFGGVIAGGTLLILKGAMPPLGLVSELILLGQVSCISGLLTELSHLMTNRPRPFVYENPELRGKDPAHYTSFYSGHTSFSAASSLALFLFLLRRRSPVWLLFLSGVSGSALIFLTGVYRVFAGRHFITDVTTGAIAGALTALVVTVLYLKRNR